MTLAEASLAPAAAPVPVPPRSWLSLYCSLHWQPADVDTFLTGTLAPWLDGLRDAGRIADWFYLRYLEQGPHLRVRIRDPRPGLAPRLRAELARLVAGARHELAHPGNGNAPDWRPHGEVREIPYLAEVARYGGPAALPVAEDVFCRSSQVAVQAVAAAGTVRQRLTVATELAMATGRALGLDRLGTARWLRAHAASWRWQSEATMLPPVAGQTQAVRLVAGQPAALRRSWERVGLLVDGDPAEAGGVGGSAPVRQWADAVRHARARLAGQPVAQLGPQTGRGLAVWASQLHMLCNRLGVTPDEERSVCWLVAGAVLAPQGLVPYFADAADAPDRRFLEASKYLPGQFEAQTPADDDAPPEPSRRWYPGTPVTLPARDLAGVSLAGALRGRASARGELVGPVGAADLGALLWHGYGTTGTVHVRLPDGTDYQLARRPYPSGGQQYPAQLRLVALDVAGLAPGTYHVDPVERVLWRMGPPPSRADLAAASSWFGAPALPKGGIDLTRLPALLGLYVGVAASRTRYGIRTPRLALVEAGHLAQNLALVAAGTGLSLGMIGGFYDDLANELFGLDGVDELLVYLLPVGRPPAAGAVTTPTAAPADESPGRQG